MRFAADVLSLLRVVLTVPVVAYGLAGNWKVAFIVLILAWATDPIDGLLARRYGSLQDEHPNFDSDGIADTVLAFGSSAVPVIYAWLNLSTWIALILTGIYTLTVVSGVLMTTVMNTDSSVFVRMVIRINMILFHGLIQIVAVIAWFGFMAFGWGAVADVLVGAAVLGYLQLTKINLWFKGVIK